jgi:hypothetical protein
MKIDETASLSELRELGQSIYKETHSTLAITL